MAHSVQFSANAGRARQRAASSEHVETRVPMTLVSWLTKMDEETLATLRVHPRHTGCCLHAQIYNTIAARLYPPKLDLGYNPAGLSISVMTFARDSPCAESHADDAAKPRQAIFGTLRGEDWQSCGEIQAINKPYACEMLPPAGVYIATGVQIGNCAVRKVHLQPRVREANVLGNQLPYLRT
jgi:hypothetical protein